MSDYSLNTTTEFRVRELSLNFPTGEKIDISSIFEEINLYDNMFTPCMSANIVIRDSVNLFERLTLDGDETVMVKLDKGKDMPDGWSYSKKFSIYTVSDRTNVNMTTQVYTIHLVNPDFLFSLQNKVTQRYQGPYSSAVYNILTNYLRVPAASPNFDAGESGLGSIYPTTRIHDFIVPALSPFDAILQITKKSTYKNNLPDFVFYESPQVGYNFAPLSEMVKLDARYDINFKHKNVERQIGDELLGATNFKVLSSFNLFDTIRDGSYAGKFIGFDTLTRTQSITKIQDVFTNSDGTGANQNSNLVPFKNKSDKEPYEMYDSRVVSYPYALSRADLKYIKEKDPASVNKLDNTHEYVFQRKAILTNLMQKRMQVTLPGNFGLFTGDMVNLFVPRFGIKEENASAKDSLDTTLTGKYIIIGVRHIVQYNKHETIIEVASDSNMA